MRKKQVFYLLFFLFSCNHIETGDSLSRPDIEYIQSLRLLDKDEKIYNFYSEFKKENAGNFFTDKRIATYWIDERDKEKSQLSFAFYADIKSIDTIYYAGATYSPYMLITKTDDTQFRVSANGKKEEVKYFFEGALAQWKRRK
jgi:bisphosphoglycerate-independent phosphoglycerate mutase (AlkP superfamily)